MMIRTHRVGLSLLLFLLLAPTLSAQLNRHLQISSSRVDFDTLCGEVACRDVTLVNISTDPIEILSLTTPQVPFSQSATPPLVFPVTIPSGGTQTIQYCFSPTIPGLAGSGNDLIITVDTGDAANLARDTLELRGRSRSGSIVIEPSDLNIGGILVGSQTCRQVTIRNDGNAPVPLTTLANIAPPFTITPAPTGTLAPGGSRVVTLCFNPTSVGRFNDQLVLANGPCRGDAVLTLQGAGMDIAPDIGPILQVSPTSIDFDTTRCGTVKCREITIRNVGNAPSEIDNFDSLIFPFSGTYPATPYTLEPDSSLVLRFCYAPDDAPRQDSQLVHFNGDSRYSLTIATLFDVSGSMDTLFGGSRTILKINAAHDGGVAFLGALISDTLRGVVDTAAVYQFGSERDYQQLQNYTTDVTALIAAVPNIALNTGTCIFYALEQVIADLRQENFPGRRVIVLLTDGQNNSGCAQQTLAQIIADAQAAGVRIYTIGIGDVGDVDDVELGALASQTGGRYFFASTADSLLSVYQQISEDLSKGADGYVWLKGEGSAPLLTIDPPLIQFDSVRVDSTRCATVTFENSGNAPWPGGPVEGFDPPFATTTPILPPLVPGESVSIEICFGPDRLRLQDDTISLSYFRCADEELSARLEGVGYDSVVVEMRGRYIGKPGSTIDIPVYLLDPLPEKYRVDSIRFGVRFNKTMLSIAPDFVTIDGGAADGMIAEVEAADYTTDTAFVSILLHGGRAVSDLPTSELARLRFLVLLGNSMETTVETYSATFADGNPKVGRINPAIFAIDSICYLPDRLLDGSARYNGTITKVTTQGSQVNVRFEVVMAHDISPVPISVELYDRTGRVVMSLGEMMVDQSGTYQIAGGGEKISSGIYYVALRVGERSHTVLTTIGGSER